MLRRDGTYRSLTKWYKTEEGDLAGEIELPVAVGIVGGVVSVHPMAKIALKILGVKTSQELAMISAGSRACSKFGCNQGVSFRRHTERSYETSRKKYCGDGWS